MSKVCVLTGATGALGWTIAHTLLDAGYDLIACGRNAARLEALGTGRLSRSRFVFPWVCDLTTSSSLDLTEALDAFAREAGPVNLLVCAHGAPPCTIPTLDLRLEDADAVYNTDVLGTLRMAQVVGAQMVAQRRGAMVFLSSAHAHQTYPARAVYSMAKTAVVGLARALAVEWGPYNVRVNSVSPWQVAGETRSTAVAAQEAAQTGEDTETLYRRRAPLGRLVTREDVAQMVLAVAENRSLTGQDIRLDCGVAASMWHQDFARSEE